MEYQVTSGAERSEAPASSLKFTKPQKIINFFLFSLVKKVDSIEENLGNIIVKIDIAVTKMVNVEKSRQTKMQSMNKILDAIIEDNDGCK